MKEQILTKSCARQNKTVTTHLSEGGKQTETTVKAVPRVMMLVWKN